MRRKLTRIAVVAVMAAVVLQSVGAGFAAPRQVQSGAPTSGADEVYVEGDGDVVLVSNPSPGSTDGDINRTEFGVDVNENLAYMLVTDDVEGTPEVSGALSATANRTAMWADGNLSVSNPPSLEAFNFDASGVTDSETSRADLAISATMTDQSGASSFIDSAVTNGSMTVSANQLTASGNLDFDTSVPLPGTNEQSYSYEIVETSSGYDISVDTSTTVPAQYNTVPENRAQAKQALEQQFQQIAMQVGGSASVQIDSFSRTTEGEQIRVEQAYTIQLQGVKSGIGQIARFALAQSEQVSTEQANELANALTDVEINRLSVQYDVTQSGISGSFAVDVENYSSLAMTTLDVMGSMEEGSSSSIDRIRKQFEAQRASGLEQQFSWSGSLTLPDADSIAVDFEAQARSSNWAAYVDELQSRDVPVLESRFDIAGGIAGDQIILSGNGSVSGDQLYSQLARGFPSAGEAPADAAAMMSAFRESRPRKAKMVATYGADGVRFEAGAAFGNLSVLRDAIVEQSELPPVTSVVGRADQQGEQSFVRVSNAVSGDASEADVRSLAYVGQEAQIHMPGEGERDFESMDVERAESFLGLDGGPGGTSGSSGPGFGPVAALVGVVAAALILMRRD